MSVNYKKITGKIIVELLNFRQSVMRKIMKHQFNKCGEKVTFFPVGSYFNYKNISISDNVYIGPRAFMLAHLSHIYIGRNTAIGPNCSIIGGNHRFDIIGKPINCYSDSDKRPEDDMDVHIGEDVWVGCNVTILKGVNIGKGCIIAAGAVVTKSILPYSIVGGIPAKIIKQRFTPEEIEKHESLILKGDL